MANVDGTSSEHRDSKSDPLYWSGAGLLLAIAVLGLIKPALTLWRFIPLDPNEGWNAYFSEIALSGGALYPLPDSLIRNNYPPLSFYIVGGAGRLIGDNIFAGRIVALSSLLFVAWALYCWLRLTGSGWRIGLIAAAAFLGYAVTYGRDYVAMNDPQWLAHAVMMGGLLVLWHGKVRTPALILASILMIAGGWIKQLLVPLPLATSIWLLWRSRPAFATWIVCFLIALSASAAIAWWLYGSVLFHSLNYPRQFLMSHYIQGTKQLLQCLAPLLALSLVTLAEARRDERAAFVSSYLIIAGATGVAARGGVGIDVNAFFDLMIAGSLAAALGVEILWRRRKAAVGSAATGVLGAYVAVCAATLAPEQLSLIESLNAREQAARDDVRLIESRGHQRAACEMPALCFWAKTPFALDFFYFGQRLKTGGLPVSACAQVFSGKRLALLQLTANQEYRRQLLPDECNATIVRNYRPIRDSIYGTYMIPASSGGS